MELNTKIKILEFLCQWTGKVITMAVSMVLALSLIVFIFSITGTKLESFYTLYKIDSDKYELVAESKFVERTDGYE